MRLQSVLLILLLALFLITGCSTAGRVPADEAAEAWYNLGNAYTELGRHSDAVKAYTKARRLNPELLSAGFNLARVYILLEQYENSLEQLEQLLEEDPLNRTVLETKAWVYHLQGNTAGALELYNEILADFDGSRNSLYNSAVILSESEQYAESLNRYKRLYELYPDEEGVVFEIAYLEASLDNPEEALFWLEKRLAAVSDDVEALELAGDMYVKRKMYAEAVTAYRRVEALPETPEGDVLGRVMFKISEILFLFMEDTENGMTALQASIDTGWKNQDDYDRLLLNSDTEWYAGVAELLSDEEAGTEDSEPADE